ncbi:MAG: ABC transporter permease subunit [Gemmatimonadetes bacterium]|nr:ABC transporter permease subunit [Gemmatimonadota bacterium]
MNPVLSIFLRKELRDLRGNPQVLPGYLILPLMAVVIPTIMLAFMPFDPTAAAAVDPDIVALFRLASRDPSLAVFPERERMFRLLVREFVSFFLLMPVILASMSAGLAIAAEKQQRTLEPILATPLSDRDLLLAKLLASLVPAVVVTWGAVLLSVIATAIVTDVRLGAAFWPTPAVLVTILILAPLAGAAAALLGIRVSVKAADIQAAVQASGLWVIPAGILLIAVVGRPAARSLPIAFGAVVLVGAIVWWLFRINLRKFEREEILTRWV